MSILRQILVVIVALTAASAASAAIYLKIPGVSGGATDPKFKGWIEISSVSGLPPVTSTAANVKPKNGGEITVTKGNDIASTELARVHQGGRPIPLMTLNKDGAEATLTVVTIASIKIVDGREVYTLRFATIEWK